MSLEKSQKIYSWKKELKEIFLISLIGIPWGFFMCGECGHLYYSMIVSASIWIVLWKGNDYLSYFMDIKYQWLKQPVHRLVLGIIGHTVLTTLAIVGIFYFYQFFMNISIGNMQSMILLGIGVTFIVTIILHSAQFLISWRQMAVESERMNKEVISAKYEALKNQVNPHFLFNSFNVLTNLVYEDQDTAAKFIKKLSDVYRYVLDSREKELVSLKEEMGFVESYIFLQKMRHNEGLNFKVEMPTSHNFGIAPLALQMLIENAIKHNIASEEFPLTISVKIKDDYLEIVNTLQKKNILKEDSSGVGISNIKARYKYLSNTPVEILQEKNQFIVRLPLINLKDADIDN